MSGSCATTGLNAEVCFGTCCVPPSPEEVLRQNITKALRDAGAWCGVCDYETGPCTDCLATLGDYADDLLSVVRAYAAQVLRAEAAELREVALLGDEHQRWNPHRVWTWLSDRADAIKGRP